MDVLNLTVFFFMGLGLGMAHAFDPDHLAAVGAASSGGQQQIPYSDYALRWSLGHAGALGIVAIIVFLFGAAIPTHVSAFAEAGVAFLLLGLGFFGLWRTFYASDEAYDLSKGGVTLVGLVHGTAGSAPLLALIPMGMASPAVGLFYVVFFSAGVALAMVALGTSLSHIVRFCGSHQYLTRHILSVIFALFSILIGAYLLIF